MLLHYRYEGHQRKAICGTDIGAARRRGELVRLWKRHYGPQPEIPYRALSRLLEENYTVPCPACTAKASISTHGIDPSEPLPVTKRED
jgi:hypothetical protein